MEFRGGQGQTLRLIQGRPGDVWAGCAAGSLAAQIGTPVVDLLPGNDPRNVLRVREAVALTGANLLVAQSSHAHNACLLAGIPLIVHRRNHRPPGNIWKYRRAAATIVDSQFVRDICSEAGVPRLHLVYDGYDPPPVHQEDQDRLPPRAPERIRIVAAGALVPDKGHSTLIDAMRLLPATMECVIAGEGPLRAELEHAAASLSGRLWLVGQLRSAGALMASADVFVQPSLHEALGGAVIEAMAMGCRVVATLTGGIPELVGETGELVQPGNPQALAGAILRALEGPAGLGVARAQRYSTRCMIEATSEIYGDYSRIVKERAR